MRVQVSRQHLGLGVNPNGPLGDRLSPRDYASDSFDEMQYEVSYKKTFVWQSTVEAFYWFDWLVSITQKLLRKRTLISKNYVVFIFPRKSHNYIYNKMSVVFILTTSKIKEYFIFLKISLLKFKCWNFHEI